jgi:hypothetical protein
MHSHAGVPSYPTAKNAFVQVSETPYSATDTLIGRMWRLGSFATASGSAWWDSRTGSEKNNNGLREARRGDGAAHIGLGFKAHSNNCRSVLT